MVKIGDVGTLIVCLMPEYSDYIGETVEVVWTGSTIIVVRSDDGNEFYVNFTDLQIFKERI